ITLYNKMDRAGADFFSVVQQIKEKLGANPVPVQIPIGAEENFQGYYRPCTDESYCLFNDDEALGTRFEIEEIPADMMEEAEEWRGKAY
ncbi:MAG: elongation factor G, partial [Marinilabiliales bacterium]|nr:elongation factor G [Marinilabiliales bacterium]